MSKLNLLVIQGVPPKKKDGWFNTVGLEAYNALQLFMHFFKKTEIDGAGKLTIYVGEKPEDKPVYFYDEKFKIAVYYVDEQTVQKRKDLKPEEWEGIRFMLKHNLSTKPEVYIDADKKTMYSLFNRELN